MVRGGPTWDLSKPDELEAAIREANPAAGNFLPLENLLQQYRTRPEAEFRRYHLNQWTSAPEQWIGHEMWNGAAGKVRCACQGSRAATGAD